MTKIKNYLLNCIKFLSGSVLLVLVIIFWAIALLLSSFIEAVNWIEKKLTKMMKKCFGEELTKL